LLFVLHFLSDLQCFHAVDLATGSAPSLQKMCSIILISTADQMGPQRSTGLVWNGSRRVGH